MNRNELIQQAVRDGRRIPLATADKQQATGARKLYEGCVNRDQWHGIAAGTLHVQECQLYRRPTGTWVGELRLSRLRPMAPMSFRHTMFIGLDRLIDWTALEAATPDS